MHIMMLGKSFQQLAKSGILLRSSSKAKSAYSSFVHSVQHKRAFTHAPYACGSLRNYKLPKRGAACCYWQWSSLFDLASMLASFWSASWHEDKWL